MKAKPTPEQFRWMLGRAASLAVIAGGAAALLFGGLRAAGSQAFPTAFLVGSVAGTCSFIVTMALFALAMPRLDPRLAASGALALGGMAALLVGFLLQPTGGPV